jgi:hypothetical protein
LTEIGLSSLRQIGFRAERLDFFATIQAVLLELVSQNLGMLSHLSGIFCILSWEEPDGMQ